MYFAPSPRHDVRPSVPYGGRALTLDDALDVLIPPSFRTVADDSYRNAASCSFVTIEYGNEADDGVGAGYVRVTRAPLYNLHRSELLAAAAAAMNTTTTTTTANSSNGGIGAASSAAAPLPSAQSSSPSAAAASSGGGDKYDTTRQGGGREAPHPSGGPTLAITAGAIGVEAVIVAGKEREAAVARGEGGAEAGQSAQALTSAALGPAAAEAVMTRQDIKNGLMAALARSPGAETELGSADEEAAAHRGKEGEESGARLGEEEMRRRIVGQQCNASHLLSCGALARLGLCVLTRRTDPHRLRAECITAVDLSHTQLGLVGPDVLRGRETERDGDALAQYVRLHGRFYPDESPARERSAAKVRQLVAQRSLALYLVAPLLFVPGYPLYRIQTLCCAHCALTDADAYGLALVLSVKPSRHHVCLLETLDMAYNAITASGANYLKKALKFNTTLTTLSLAHNPALASATTLLEAIHRRLQRNAQGKSNAAWYHRRKKWLS